jgi:5-methylcytosine-specific restriction endonuclease McrA
MESLSQRLQNLWTLCHEANRIENNILEDNPRYDVNKKDLFNIQYSINN